MTIIRYPLRLATFILLIAASTIMIGIPRNAHATMVRRASPIDLLSLHMSTPTIGWAIGQSAIVRTTDGGHTWADITPHSIDRQHMQVTATYFPTERVAWVALAGQGTQPVTIWHTTNGGQTWQHSNVTLPEQGARVSQIQFMPGSQIGWLFAGLGAGAGSSGVQILRTVDGGQHWVAISTTDPPHSTPGSLPLGGIKSGLGFRTATAGYATGVIYGPPGFTYLYTTADGGRTWQHQQLVLPSGSRNDMPSLEPPVFLTAGDGVLPVTLYQPGPQLLLYSTHDGGKTWTATTPLPGGRSEEILSVSDIWAVVAPPASAAQQTPSHLAVTHDGGSHWTIPASGIALHDGAMLDFLDLRTGFVLYPAQRYGDAHSTLLATTDGGRTWTVLHPLLD